MRSTLAKILISLLIFEVITRTFTRFPIYNPADQDFKPEGIYAQNPNTGWRNKPGVYTRKTQLPDRETITYTISERGTRVSKANQKPDSCADILFVGCSYTFGLKVGEADNFVWKLQSKYPALEMHNLASGGYGTLQSKLTLEKWYSGECPAPKRVIYGFIPFHETRNIAHPDWVLLLSHHTRSGTKVNVPYALLDSTGGLTESRLDSLTRWPLAQYLASVGLIEELTFRLTRNQRGSQMKEVTQLLMRELAETATRNGSKFSVVALDGTINYLEPYEKFLKDNEIDFLNCRFEDISLPEMRVSGIAGVGHPSPKMHSLWVKCIEEGIPEFSNRQRKVGIR